MAKSKEQKRKEAIERAKEHYRNSALPDYLRYVSPRTIEIDLQPDPLEVTISNTLGFSVEWTDEDIEQGKEYSLRRINSETTRLIRQAALANVDLDGVDLIGEIEHLQFTDLESYKVFYKALVAGNERGRKEDFNSTRIGCKFTRVGLLASTKK